MSRPDSQQEREAAQAWISLAVTLFTLFTLLAYLNYTPWLRYTHEDQIHYL